MLLHLNKHTLVPLWDLWGDLFDHTENSVPLCLRFRRQKESLNVSTDLLLGTQHIPLCGMNQLEKRKSLCFMWMKGSHPRMLWIWEILLFQGLYQITELWYMWDSSYHEILQYMGLVFPHSELNTHSRSEAVLNQTWTKPTSVLT